MFPAGNRYDTKGVERVFAYLEIYGFSGDVSLDLGDVTLRSITGYRNTARNDQQDYDQSRFEIVRPRNFRSEEHTSELQSLMRISYAVFCLKKKKIKTNKHIYKSARQTNTID